MMSVSRKRILYPRRSARAAKRRRTCVKYHLISLNHRYKLIEQEVGGTKEFELVLASNYVFEKRL